MSIITNVHELLADAGVDVSNGLANFTDEEMHYEDHAGVSRFKEFVYVHRIKDLIRDRLLDPWSPQVAPLFLGPSAIGKTEAIRAGFNAAAQLMGREPMLHECHVSQMVITDVTGVPRDDGHERTVFYPPRIFALRSALPQHQQACERFDQHWNETGITDWSIMTNPYTEDRFPLYGYFWDEVTNPSSPTVVHQCFSLWYGNFVASHKLVDDAFHVLAGNRVEDQTNSIPLARSATSRFQVIQVVPSLAGWISNWALELTKIGGEEITRGHPAVISFLHNNSRFFAPSAVDYPQMSNFPSPRTWAFISRLLHKQDRNPMAEDLLKASIVGFIGDDAANLFDKYLKYWHRLVDVRKLLDSKQEGHGPYGWLPKEWPQELDVRLMLIQQMASMVTEANAKRFMAFMLDDDKFKPEQSVMAMKMTRMMGKLDDLTDKWAYQEFHQWALKYKHVIL